ncbi:hypothetical protein GWK47_000847 [Chionoecetes opilio]|uniref:Uncharacterized protein n=1 Tax=Chionoecetes opilio TaxID=41210 RepID=A0A8J4YA85_CHIOP|nr:hypothetical protein GWK47_000847 [Chionoecetes opilio]
MTLRDVTRAAPPWGLVLGLGGSQDPKDNFVTKFEKLHGGVQLLKKGAMGRSEAKTQKKRILRTSRQPFDVAQGNALTFMTTGGQRVPPAQREPASGRMGGVDSLLSAQETRQSLRLGKTLLSPPKKKKAAASSSGASRVLAASRSNTFFSCFSQMRIGEWRSESCEAGEKGPQKTRLSRTGGPRWMNP